MQIIKPSIHIVEAVKHENLQLKCEHTNAKPEPIVSWLFNGTLIRESDIKYYSEKNVLLIKNLVSSDSGTYSCILSNGYHSEQRFSYFVNLSGMNYKNKNRQINI